jgi:hypothetical protein
MEKEQGVKIRELEHHIEALNEKPKESEVEGGGGAVGQYSNPNPNPGLSPNPKPRSLLGTDRFLSDGNHQKPQGELRN